VRGYVECELPNEKLNLFEGIVTLELPNQPSEILPVTLDNLLLRGTFLRNTEFVYGAVIYAGSETKIYK
jgi:phospholipid-transporting ATPase